MDVIFDIETTGLNPMTDRILCISFIKHENLNSFCGEDESKILQNFWNVVNEDDDLIGFNIDTFDIPFLIKRSLINFVKISKFRNNIDLRKIVNSFRFSYDKYSKGRLRDWANILLIKITTFNGDEMPILYQDKNWKEIREHCEEDVKIIKELYERCKVCGLI